MNNSFVKIDQLILCVLVIRDCATIVRKDECKQMTIGDFKGLMCTCQKDLCNGVSSTAISALPLIVLSLTAMLY